MLKEKRCGNERASGRVCVLVKEVEIPQSLEEKKRFIQQQTQRHAAA
jgi:hypothetical protein